MTLKQQALFALLSKHELSWAIPPAEIETELVTPVLKWKGIFTLHRVGEYMFKDVALVSLSDMYLETYQTFKGIVK